MSMNGEPGGRSLKVPVALMDVLAGHHLKEGLLLALLERQQTGRGRLVDVSLIQAAVSSLANQATNYMVAGTIPGKKGSSHPNIAPYGDVFVSKDGKEILLAVGTDRQFDQLVNLLDIREVVTRFPFGDNRSRVANCSALNRVLQDAIGSRDAAGLLSALEQERIPAGQIRNVAEALQDPEIQSIILSRSGLSGIRTFVGQGSSILPHLSPPPRLGEHTSAILMEVLNMNPTAIKSLQDRCIIQ